MENKKGEDYGVKIQKDGELIVSISIDEFTVFWKIARIIFDNFDIKVKNEKI